MIAGTVGAVGGRRRRSFMVGGSGRGRGGSVRLIPSGRSIWSGRVRRLVGGFFGDSGRISYYYMQAISESGINRGGGAFFAISCNFMLD
jgi:hypothetical protein